MTRATTFAIAAIALFCTAAVKPCVADCIADCVWLTVPQPTEWQHIGNQIDAAMIFTRSHLRKGVVSWSSHRPAVSALR